MPAPSLLMDQLFKTVENIGVQKTITILRKAQYEKIKFDDVQAAKVVKHVAEHFKIPIYEIVFGNGRLNERKHAIGFAAYYLRYSYDYTMDEVAKSLKTELTLCHKYCRIIASLNENYKSDEKYISIRNKLDEFFPKIPKNKI